MELEVLGMNFTCILASLSSGDLPQKDCLLPILSKALGYCIVAASTIVKVPQIYIILKNRSIEGLSVASFELEVVGFTIALAYCLRKELPFSAYGELVFLLLQGTWLKSAIYCAVAPTILAGQINPILFEALYASQHAIFFFARIPQIWENYRNKSTGTLSFLTNFISSLMDEIHKLSTIWIDIAVNDIVLRWFTSIQEKAPTNMVVGSVLGVLMNGIIVTQILMYKPTNAKKENKTE